MHIQYGVYAYISKRVNILRLIPVGNYAIYWYFILIPVVDSSNYGYFTLVCGIVYLAFDNITFASTVLFFFQILFQRYWRCFYARNIFTEIKLEF